jgi:hypothetical protein
MVFVLVAQKEAKIQVKTIKTISLNYYEIRDLSKFDRPFINANPSIFCVVK